MAIYANMREQRKARLQAARAMAESIQEDYPEFVAEQERKYGISWMLIVSLFLPLIMDWLQEWLSKRVS